MKLGEFIGNFTINGSDPKQAMIALAEYYAKQAERVKETASQIGSYIYSGEWTSDYDPSFHYININGYPYNVSVITPDIKLVYDNYFSNYGSNENDIYNTTITSIDIDGNVHSFTYKQFEDTLSGIVDQSYINSVVTDQFSTWFSNGTLLDDVSQQSANILSQFVNKEEHVVEQVNSILKAVRLAGESLADKVSMLSEMLGLNRFQTVTDQTYAENMELDFITGNEISNYTGVNPVAGLVTGLDFSNLGSAIVSTYELIWRAKIKISTTIWKAIGNWFKKGFEKVTTYVTDTLIDPVDFSVDGKTMNEYTLPTRYYTDKIYMWANGTYVYPGEEWYNTLNNGDLYLSIFGNSYRVSNDRQSSAYSCKTNIYTYTKPKDVYTLALGFVNRLITSGIDFTNVHSDTTWWQSLTVSQINQIWSSLNGDYPLKNDVSEYDLVYNTRVTKLISDLILHYATITYYSLCWGNEQHIVEWFNSEVTDEMTILDIKEDILHNNALFGFGQLTQEICHILLKIYQATYPSEPILQNVHTGMYNFNYNIRGMRGSAQITNKDLLLNYTMTPMIDISSDRYLATYSTSASSDPWGEYDGLITNASYSSQYGWNVTGTSSTKLPLEHDIMILLWILFGLKDNPGTDFFIIPYSRYEHISPNISIKTDQDNIAAVEKLIIIAATTVAAIAATIYIGKGIAKFKRNLIQQNALVQQLDWKLGEALFASGGASTIAVNNYTKDVIKNKRKLRLMSKLGGILGVSAVTAAYNASDSQVPLFNNQNIDTSSITDGISDIEQLIH